MKLLKQAVIGLLVHLLLLSSSASAQTTEQIVPYEVLYAPTFVTYAATHSELESTPVVQEIPDPSRVWLDGRVSFVGGELSTSQRQLEYAQAHRIPLMSSESEYQRSVRTGRFVLLQHPNLEIGAGRPYVLTTTATFIYEVVENFGAVGCGRLRINDASRLTTERPANGSPFSVHPAGMALDLRVINLSERCYAVLSELLYEAEREQRADVTREWEPEHFHVVVIPEQAVRRVFYEARYEEAADGGQGE